MAEPSINIRISLLSETEEALGGMDLQLPTQVILDNGGPGQLEKLVEEELMPEAVEATISAHMQAMPADARDYELNRIHRAVMKMYVDDNGEAMEFEMKFQR